MKTLAIFIFFCGAILTSCKVGATDLEKNISEESVTKNRVLETPTPKPKFNIHSKIGIAEVLSGKPSCLRTKNGDLAENTPISIIISLDELPQKVLTAIVEKKLEKSCARPASESGDKNPGENYFYSLKLIEVDDQEISYDVGIAVIEPNKPLKVQNKLASVDLDDDGKAEFFRSCGGFEGTHFTIWTGKPLKGKRIWHSFFYVDYDTVATCKKKDWEDTDN